VQKNKIINSNRLQGILPNRAVEETNTNRDPRTSVQKFFNDNEAFTAYMSIIQGRRPKKDEDRLSNAMFFTIWAGVAKFAHSLLARGKARLTGQASDPKELSETQRELINRIGTETARTEAEIQPIALRIVQDIWKSGFTNDERLEILRKYAMDPEVTDSLAVLAEKHDADVPPPLRWLEEMIRREMPILSDAALGRVSIQPFIAGPPGRVPAELTPVARPFVREHRETAIQMFIAEYLEEMKNHELFRAISLAQRTELTNHAVNTWLHMSPALKAEMTGQPEAVFMNTRVEVLPDHAWVTETIRGLMTERDDRAIDSIERVARSEERERDRDRPVENRPDAAEQGMQVLDEMVKEFEKGAKAGRRK